MAKLSLPPPGFFIGDEHYKEAQSSTTPGSEQTVLTDDVVPSGKLRKIHLVALSTPFTGCVRIFKDSTLIGSGRIAAGEINFQFNWLPPRSIAAGEQVIIKFEQISGKPSSDLEVYLMAEDCDI